MYARFASRCSITRRCWNSADPTIVIDKDNYNDNDNDNDNDIYHIDNDNSNCFLAIVHQPK